MYNLGYLYFYVMHDLEVLIFVLMHYRLSVCFLKGCIREKASEAVHYVTCQGMILHEIINRSL